LPRELSCTRIFFFDIRRLGTATGTDFLILKKMQTNRQKNLKVKHKLFPNYQKKKQN